MAHVFLQINYELGVEVLLKTFLWFPNPKPLKIPLGAFLPEPDLLDEPVKGKAVCMCVYALYTLHIIY